MEEQEQRAHHASSSQQSAQSSGRLSHDVLFQRKRVAKKPVAKGGSAIAIGVAKQPWGNATNVASSSTSQMSVQGRHNFDAVSRSSQMALSNVRTKSGSTSQPQLPVKAAAYVAKYARSAVMSSQPKQRPISGISTDSGSSDPLNTLSSSQPFTQTSKKRVRSPVKVATRDVYSDDSDTLVVGGNKNKAQGTGKGRAITLKRVVMSPQADEMPLQRNQGQAAPLQANKKDEVWFVELLKKRQQSAKNASGAGGSTKQGRAVSKSTAPSIMSSSSDVEVELAGQDIMDDLLRRKSKRTAKRRRDMFEGLDEADVAFCESTLDLNKLCPEYCSEPLPIKPSDSLRELQNGLLEVSRPIPTPTNPDARRAPWDQTISFCSLHKAESTIIPLGIRQGYPSDVDFDSLAQRIDGTFLWRAVTAMCENPQELSTWFKATTRKIEKQGKRVWQSLAEQSRQKRMDLIQPGYYGDTGKLVLTRYFQRRHQVGDLPALSCIAPGKTRPICHPLSADEFIINILVPEVATFLIMEDQGWRGQPFIKSAPGWNAARERAFETMRSSVAFGRALHHGDTAPVPESLTGDIERRQTQASTFPAYFPSPMRPSSPPVMLPSSQSSPLLEPTRIRKQSSPILIASSPEISDSCAQPSPPSSPPRSYLNDRHRARVFATSTPARLDKEGYDDAPQTLVPASSSPARVNLDDYADSDEDQEAFGSDATAGGLSDGDIRSLGSQFKKGSLEQIQSDSDMELVQRGWETVVNEKRVAPMVPVRNFIPPRPTPAHRSSAPAPRLGMVRR